MKKLLKLITIIISLTLLTACMTTAPRENARGNEAYEQNDYMNALAAYQQGQEIDPDAPELHYNAANALHQLEAYSEAITETTRALAEADDELQQRAFYNLGNSLFEAGQYEEALGAYIEALKRDPNDMDAKHNLELAWKMLEQITPTPQSQPSTPSPEPKQDEQETTPTPSPRSQDSSTPTPEGGEDQAASTPTPEGSPTASGEQSQPEDGAATPTPQPAAQPQEGMSEEQAEQLIEAIIQDQKTLQEYIQRQMPSKPVEKDW